MQLDQRILDDFDPTLWQAMKAERHRQENQIAEEKQCLGSDYGFAPNRVDIRD